MSHLTTHVLDATTGTPAVGIGLRLSVAGGTMIAEAVTDADGRAAVGPDLLAAGDYDLTFATGAHFAAKQIPAFYPAVTITFSVEVAGDGSSPHYHVPLLLSPFAYSTYRGS